MQDSDPQTEAIAFLESLEQRHNQVLDDLDALNQRIEEVLKENLPKRDADDSQKDSRKKPKKPAGSVVAEAGAALEESQEDEPESREPVRIEPESAVSAAGLKVTAQQEQESLGDDESVVDGDSQQAVEASSEPPVEEIAEAAEKAA